MAGKSLSVPRPNATLPIDGKLQVRVGIPHAGGALMAEANNSGYPVMVSAAAFWRNGKLRPADLMRGGEIFMADLALDSAGFTAMSGWARKGPQAGMSQIYPWSLQDQVDLVESLGSSCSWWSQSDFCCEPEIAGDAAERRRRIELTARSLSYTLQEVQLREVLAERQFANERNAACRRRLVLNNSVRPPVPVLQGWTADDYRYSADLLAEAWAPWKGLYTCSLIGIGSVCRRSLHDKHSGILAVLRAIEGRIPEGAKLHAFGVKGEALSALSGHPLLASADSMAYDFAARMSAAKHRRSNTMQQRVQAMHAWVGRHTRQPSPQLRLF